MKNTTTFDNRGVVLSVESRGDPRQHTIRNRFPDGGRWDETYIEFGGYFGCYGPHVFRAAPDLLDSLKGCLALLENLETPPSNTKSKCISDAQEAIAMAEPIVPNIIPVAPPVSQVREPEQDLQVEEEKATLSLGTINMRLEEDGGMKVTATFLTKLDFPAKSEGAAKLYRESQFGAICSAIADHTHKVATLHRLEKAA